ncbi:MAG: excinuclease ABC subunit UvrA [Candidatus Syntrophoarchaeum sp. WYZ-LMO15]|nr:MAG: excinuclease ABC subunit UvrA [Candidatus Syntrophoarchaeum sp. WYZ-LMO15]
MEKNIIIKGVREHNLKGFDLNLPRNKFIVITGVSGSGKSSLAFDTIYAEGQRRYVESLSAYARQFLEQMKRPDVDHIEGLSPAISIDQKSAGKNPRSTVGTVTEIYDYLRLLYAKIGVVHCPGCGREIKRQSVDEIVDRILGLLRGKDRIQILSPIVKGRKGEYRRLFEDLKARGFVRVRVDGEIYHLDDEIRLEKNIKHHIDLVVDRIVVEDEDGLLERITDAVEVALKEGGGTLRVIIDESEHLFSEAFSCPVCEIDFEELSPRLFSFNSPYGACPHCEGLGARMMIDEELVVPDKSLSLMEGAIRPWGRGRYTYQMLQALADRFGFSMQVPFRDLDPKIQRMILYGPEDGEIWKYPEGKGFEGVIPWMMRRYRDPTSRWSRREVERYMRVIPCKECGGTRLNPVARAVKVGGMGIAEFTALPISEALSFIRNLKLSDREMAIAGEIIREIEARLEFLMSVGLGYLTLDRASSTLSGGEAQRIRLASQIGSGLVGVLYVLDEPSIGLHQRDNRRLIETLRRLCEIGNTLIVVEHDEEIIRSADHIVDLGPGAGEHGGWVVAEGTVDEICQVEESITGRFLSGKETIPVPERRVKPERGYLVIRGASENNLKNIDVAIPVGLFTCVTGVSGSGKSTLVNEILYKALARELNHARTSPGRHRAIEGVELIDKVIVIDQSPIGRTPRSNPATYTGAFTPIRELFSRTPEARKRGYKPGRFSFNVKGGRCEACEGAGLIRIEMHFLPEKYVECDVCKGSRYNRETLEVKYKGKTILDVLNMSVEEAYEFFRDIPAIERKLRTLLDVGMGYVRLGQPATTLSGGEAQRIKLAAELSRQSTGRTLYILDEPTTGLHFADVKKLLGVLFRLRDEGNTIVVIEHHLDVIKSADYIIDLGPEGGEEGGYVVATGTPEEVARSGTYTGEWLRRVLE